MSSKPKSAKLPKVVPRPTNVYHENMIIELTLNSPGAKPTKSVTKASEYEVCTTMADSLGALKLQNLGVDEAERNLRNLIGV